MPSTSSPRLSISSIALWTVSLRCGGTRGQQAYSAVSTDRNFQNSRYQDSVVSCSVLVERNAKDERVGYADVIVLVR